MYAVPKQRERGCEWGRGGGGGGGTGGGGRRGGEGGGGGGGEGAAKRPTTTVGAMASIAALTAAYPGLFVPAPLMYVVPSHVHEYSHPHWLHWAPPVAVVAPYTSLPNSQYLRS